MSIARNPFSAKALADRLWWAGCRHRLSAPGTGRRAGTGAGSAPLPGSSPASPAAPPHDRPGDQKPSRTAGTSTCCRKTPSSPSRCVADATSPAVPPGARAAPPRPAASSLPAPLAAVRGLGRDRSEDRLNTIRCSTASAACACSSSASRFASASRSRAFSFAAPPAPVPSAHWPAAPRPAFRSGASAPASSSTPAAPATKRSKHHHTPRITHSARCVAPGLHAAPSTRRTLPVASAEGHGGYQVVNGLPTGGGRIAGPVRQRGGRHGPRREEAPGALTGAGGLAAADRADRADRVRAVPGVRRSAVRRMDVVR